MATATADARDRRVVVDASVAAKWLLPEHGSDEAAALLDDTDVELHGPELMDVEVANALWKRVRRGELSVGEALALCADVLQAPVTRHAHAALLERALEIALELGITGYDALYIALAEALDASFATADVPLATRLRESNGAVTVFVVAAAARARR